MATMKSVIQLLSLMLLPLLFSGCSESTGPGQATGTSFEENKNVRWELTEVITPAGSVDLSGYDPFSIAFHDDYTWGSDGCHTLNMTYVISNDTLHLLRGGITEPGCGYNPFPFTHVTHKPKVTFTGASMILSWGDTNYIYKSPYKKAIPYYAFWDKALRMTASNDTNFHFFERLGLYPEITFAKGRKFSLQWYNRPPQQHLYISKITGLTGVNEQTGLKFTMVTLQHQAASPNSDWNIALRIIRSDRFELVNGALRIINSTENTYYEFRTK